MDARVRLALLGGFEIDANGTAKIRLPLGAQRLLAILALGEGMHRATAAERLWPDSPLAEQPRTYVPHCGRAAGPEPCR
jgi:hypothetical protein